MQNSFEKFSIFLILLIIENYRHFFQYFWTRKILLFLQRFFKGVMSTRHGISSSIKHFVCCSWNAKFCACKISRSFADHPSKILISEVLKFYTGLTMIIQKNRHVRTHIAQNFGKTCQKYLQSFIANDIFSQNFFQILQNISSQHCNFNSLKYFWKQINI